MQVHKQTKSVCVCVTERERERERERDDNFDEISFYVPLHCLFFVTFDLNTV